MSGTRDIPLVHASLLADMRLALLAEFGACSLYAALEKRISDPELARVIAEFVAEEAEIIDKLRSLLAALGAEKIPRKSRRRALLAWCLTRLSSSRASSLALRASVDSENVIARWYGEYARYLASTGHLAHARTCGELAETKLRHARILEAWLPR